MKFQQQVVPVLLAALVLAATAPTVDAQDTTSRPDTMDVPGDTLGLSIGVAQRRTRFVVASGKTYNRVEGLPVHLGPVFTGRSGAVRFSGEVFGIIRSADTFQRDSRNLGHLVTASVRSDAGVGLKVASYDIVSAVEEWQMSRGESGLAAFLFRRDYRDHFGRHGYSATAAYQGTRSALEITFAHERWSSLTERNVLTVFRNNHPWRPNPAADDGKARLLTGRWTVDTRNDVQSPSTGWLSRVEYERGDTDFQQLGPTSDGVRGTADLDGSYGRVLLDLRRYNRISPAAQLNFRVAAGGWVSGAELPLQRRFSVGGPATIPGVRFRDTGLQPDVYTCSTPPAPPGSPAQCERVLLLQTEYREELPFRPGTIFGGTPIRIRSAALTLRPVLVAFIDFGRGWLVREERADVLAPVEAPSSLSGAPLANVVIPSELAYARGRLPPLSTFSTDVGLGVDLGLLGAYVAMSVSEGGAPINFIVRARSRF